MAVIVLIKLKTANDLQVSSLAFIKVVVAVLGILVLDCAWVLVDGHDGTLAFSLNYLINILYLFTTGLISYLWLKYVLFMLDKNAGRVLYKEILLALPLAALFAVSVVSPWTGWLFTISDGNCYQRGSFLFIQQAVSYGYGLSASLVALRSTRKNMNKEERAKAATLSSFIILPAVGSVVNVISDKLPTIWVFAALALVTVYMSLQSQQISTDGLTGLNNRRQFDRYLNARFTDSHRDCTLYLLLLDIDEFKHINDTLGHLAGDDALVAAANVFKLICGSNNAFLARYGGDEFAIVFEDKDGERPRHMLRRINAAFDAFNRVEHKPFLLTVSVGVGSSDNAASVAALIKQADDALYEMKARKKGLLRREQTH